MRPNGLKVAVARIKTVKVEFGTLQEIVRDMLQQQDLGAEKRRRLNDLLFNSERTYLLRLFSEFEESLTVLGPRLSPPCTFSVADGMATKLDLIGKAMQMNTRLRAQVDADLRQLRNELLHGRSVAPRLSFEAVYDLMRQFYRGCH